MTSLLRSDAKFCSEFFIHLLIIVPIDSCSHRTVTVDEPIPIALALLMGLQHAFAMIGGLITPPLVVIKFAVCGPPFCPELEQYAISASLIASGITSLIQVYQFRIPFAERIFSQRMFLGSGLLSVMVSQM